MVVIFRNDSELMFLKWLILAFLVVPALAHAQFNYTTNFCYTTNNGVITTNGAITITGYTGTNENVVIPCVINGYSVTSIGNDAFAYNTIPANIIVPDSVTSIGFASFDGCTSLTNIIIGSSVTNITEFPFYDCPSLEGIYFRGNAPTFHYGVVPRNNETIYYLPGTSGWSAFEEEVIGPVILWLPQIQTADASFGVQTKQFGFNVTWASGQTVVVQACTNLSNPVWSPIATNTLASGSFYFTDPRWTNYPGRFYRVSSQ
jgi:hypothetical protein